MPLRCSARPTTHRLISVDMGFGPNRVSACFARRVSADVAPGAVVRRRITYFDSGGSTESRWDTCWVIDFDETGRCAEYREWYVEGSAASG